LQGNGKNKKEESLTGGKNIINFKVKGARIKPIRQKYRYSSAKSWKTPHSELPI